MIKHIITLKKVAVPANLTEVFALIAVAGGLCVTIFLPELPIRLIGVCISVLGALGYFMLVSQRLSDSNYRPINVSQRTEFSTTVKKDGESKRIVYNDYEMSFGGGGLEQEQNSETDKSATEKLLDGQYRHSERAGSISKTDDASPKKKVPRYFDDDQPAERPRNSKSDSGTPPQDNTIADKWIGRSGMAVYSDPPPDIELQPRGAYDDIGIDSDMRIIGKATSIQPSRPTAQQSGKSGDTSSSSSRTTEARKSILAQPRILPRTAPPPTVATLLATEQPTITANATQKKSDEIPNYNDIARTVDENNTGIDSIEIENLQNEASLATATAALQIDSVEVAVAEAEEYIETQEQNTTEYLPQPQEFEAGHKRVHLSTPKFEFLEETPPVAQNEPRKELDYLLTRVLMVIRSVTAARTAVFLWVDNDKQKLVLESFISDIPEKLTQQKKLPFGTDVVSQIARSGRPEILTEIKPSAEIDLIPYYSEAAETLSFIGVPVFYNNSVVGVLCADTTQAEAYDAITVGFFGHFTKLISGLVHSYTDKYDLMQATRALEAITQFRSLVSTSQSGIADVCTALLEAASKTVDYSTLGVVVYDARISEWKVAQTMCRADITPGALGGIVNLGKSLAGYTIQNCKSNLVAPMYPGYLRCTESEEPLESGFFASVPLKSFSHNYGALFVEGNNPPMTAQDLAILEVLGEQTGLIIEQMRFNDMLSSMSLVNETRGIFNPTAFRQRINEELQRAVDFAAPMTLCLIQLDKYNTVDAAGDAAEVILQNIIELIRKQVKPYDIIGELDSSTIALALVGQEVQKVRLWAERLRKEIASTVVQLDNRRFTVTVSLGVAEASDIDSPETLMNNAKGALQISLGRSNAVTIYG